MPCLGGGPRSTPVCSGCLAIERSFLLHGSLERPGEGNGAKAEAWLKIERPLSAFGISPPHGREPGVIGWWPGGDGWLTLLGLPVPSYLEALAQRSGEGERAQDWPRRFRTAGLRLDRIEWPRPRMTSCGSCSPRWQAWPARRGRRLGRGATHRPKSGWLGSVTSISSVGGMLKPTGAVSCVRVYTRCLPRGIGPGGTVWRGVTVAARFRDLVRTLDRAALRVALGTALALLAWRLSGAKTRRGGRATPRRQVKGD